THEHGDHAKAVTDLMDCGVNVHASEGTHAALKTTMHHRAGMLKMGPVYSFGGFSLKCFDVKHDAKQPLGFLIHHDETGNVLFLTDTMYCEYTFMDLNNIIIEANYDANIA